MDEREDGIVILDGGMGHLMKERARLLPGLDFDQQFLAGAVANVQSPDVVRSCHQEYLLVGAHVITTNNFVVTPHSLSKIGKESRLGELTEAAALRAREAVSELGVPARIAGSLPPLTESYQIQDSYTPDQMRSIYSHIVEHLAPHVDILLCETMSSFHEAAAAVEAASRAGLPVWVSFTLEDSEAVRLRSGEPLAEAVTAIQKIHTVKAVLLNCCSPPAITFALPTLREAVNPGVVIGCYGNGFQKTTSEWMTGGGPLLRVHSGDFDHAGIMTPSAYTRFAQNWVEMGAKIVGGCCGIGPMHIKGIADSVL